MQGLNDSLFVFMIKNEAGEWDVQEPVTLGNIIDREIEFQFSNGDTLPLSDVDWANIEIKMSIIPNRSKNERV